MVLISYFCGAACVVLVGCVCELLMRCASIANEVCIH